MRDIVSAMVIRWKNSHLTVNSSLNISPERSFMIINVDPRHSARDSLVVKSGWSVLTHLQIHFVPTSLNFYSAGTERESGDGSALAFHQQRLSISINKWLHLPEDKLPWEKSRFTRNGQRYLTEWSTWPNMNLRLNLHYEYQQLSAETRLIQDIFGFLFRFIDPSLQLYCVTNGTLMHLSDRESEKLRLRQSNHQFQCSVFAKCISNENSPCY